MAFAINSAYTLPEILRASAPNGDHMTAVDVLSQSLPLINEGYWEQANGDTTHEFLRYATEAAGSFVRYNEGTANEAVSTKPVTEYLTRLESRLQIDTRILEKAADPVKYRREREAAHFRGLTKTFSKTIWAKGGYGVRGSDLKQIDGLGTRFSTLSQASADGTVLVSGNGGTGTSVLGSIWLVKHGMDGLFFIYPKNLSKALKETDLQVQPAYDASGNRYEVVMTKWEWEFGIGLADDRAVQRLCNITASGANSFFADTTTVQKGEYALIDMVSRLPNGSTDGAVFYAGKEMIAQIRKRLNDKSNMYFTMETVWGKPMLTFQGIPIVQDDTLAMNESTIS